MHRHAVSNLDQADALLFGRVTHEMVEAAWRRPAWTGAMPDRTEPLARTIDAAKQHEVSSTLDRVYWSSELVLGNPGKAVQRPERGPWEGLLVGGVRLPLALAEPGLIDEYEFVVQPRLAGHEPRSEKTVIGALRPRPSVGAGGRARPRSHPFPRPAGSSRLAAVITTRSGLKRGPGDVRPRPRPRTAERARRLLFHTRGVAE